MLAGSDEVMQDTRLPSENPVQHSSSDGQRMGSPDL